MKPYAIGLILLSSIIFVSCIDVDGGNKDASGQVDSNGESQTFNLYSFSALKPLNNNDSKEKLELLNNLVRSSILVPHEFDKRLRAVYRDKDKLDSTQALYLQNLDGDIKPLKSIRLFSIDESNPITHQILHNNLLRQEESGIKDPDREMLEVTRDIDDSDGWFYSESKQTDKRKQILFAHKSTTDADKYDLVISIDKEKLQALYDKIGHVRDYTRLESGAEYKDMLEHIYAKSMVSNTELVDGFKQSELIKLTKIPITEYYGSIFIKAMPRPDNTFSGVSAIFRAGRNEPFSSNSSHYPELYPTSDHENQEMGMKGKIDFKDGELDKISLICISEAKRGQDGKKIYEFHKAPDLADKMIEIPGLKLKDLNKDIILYGVQEDPTKEIYKYLFASTRTKRDDPSKPTAENYVHNAVKCEYTKDELEALIQEGYLSGFIKVAG